MRDAVLVVNRKKNREGSIVCMFMANFGELLGICSQENGDTKTGG